MYKYTHSEKKTLTIVHTNNRTPWSQYIPVQSNVHVGTITFFNDVHYQTNEEF